MIWYLLYPLRGTTQPPRLSVDHPVRRAFYRHGILTAQHWLAAMLISCAIAAMLAYPTVFLSGNPTAGFTSKPTQVWAAARPLIDREGQHVDIEMRQVWVHGSHMQALDKDVLQQALSIQEKLVGHDDLAAAHSTAPVQWGFHSPLMYWNNSAGLIESDPSVIKTINDRAQTSSSLDISLRPASVFAGKSFSRGKLVAADALVLTLMNRQQDQLGRKWQREVQSLSKTACLGCQLYPESGQVSQSWLYEFTLTPVTPQEDAILGVAYGCMAIYVLISLRRLKAFHSRFGLVVTAVTQMIMSILASFTICGLLHVNLVAVPKNAYPFVLLVIGIENMFRLINAILAYPATMATDLRVANALGDVGPISIATAAQNVLVLGLVSIVVSPGIVAFCTFAAVATIVDTFFLLTFFVAVLNVDIRRLELQDSISKSKEAAQRTKSPTPKKTWFQALLHGGLPVSTRMAGSTVSATFILTLNYHFFERSDKRIALGRWLGYDTSDAGSVHFDSMTAPPMNATLTPSEWIRMQDFDTAREVLRLVNDGAQTFIIRVFAPLIIVLPGADRTGISRDSNSWREELQEIAFHHLYPFAVVVVFIVTFVWVLMNFLLWNDAPEISEDTEDRQEDPISIDSIRMGHKLDIIKIASNRRGDIVTAGLDKTVSISSIDASTGARHTEPLPDSIAQEIMWPVRHLAIDPSGHYFALQHGRRGGLIYDRKRGSPLEYRAGADSDLILYEFAELSERTGDMTVLVMVFASGEVQFELVPGRSSSYLRLSERTIRAAAVFSDHTTQPKLAVLGSDGNLLLMDLVRGSLANPTAHKIPLGAQVYGNADVQGFVFEGQAICAVSTPDTLYLTNQDRVLSKRTMKASGQIVLGNVLTCPACGNPALSSLEVATSKDAAATLQLHAFGYQKTHGEQVLCLDSASDQCVSFANALESEHCVENAGCYQGLSHGILLGLRRVPTKPLNGNAGPVRRRRAAGRGEAFTQQEDKWEAYSLSPDGELEAVSMNDTAPDVGQQEPDLYVTTAGPSAKIDDHALAMAFGNVVKVIRLSRTNGRRSVTISRSVSLTRKRGGPRKLQ